MIIIKLFSDDSITQKVYDLLIENGIKKHEMVDVLNRITQDIEHSLWEKIYISLPLLYSLKDIVWYNLEHLPSGGEPKGRSSLKFMGSKYPNFIFHNTFYIEHHKVEDYLKELEDIRSKWSNDLYYVTIIAKTDDWQGGPENPSYVIIYDGQTEKPTKYGYDPYNIYSLGIVNDRGEPLNTLSETVLCKIESKLGSYGQEPLLRGLLEELIKCCKKAIQFNKGVYFVVESYDYTY